MNDFCFLSDNLIGRLSTVDLGEIFENGIDSEAIVTNNTCMNIQQYREQQRHLRIQRSDSISLLIARIFRGESVSSRDNSHIWNLRNQIAAEVEPIVAARQRAWMNSFESTAS